MTAQFMYYAVLAALSMLLTLLYAFWWRKQFEAHMTVIFIVIPITNLAYLLMYASHELEAVTSLMKFVYVGGCFLPWLVTMCELALCHIPVSRRIRLATLLVSTAVFVSVLSAGYSDVFYQSLTLDWAGDAMIIYRQYGPMHTVHYVCVILYLIADLAILAYTYYKKRQVSRVVLFLLFAPIPITIAVYLGGRFFANTGFELTHLSYTVAQVIYLFIARRMSYYNVSEMVVESMVQSGETGFVTIDHKGRYLGSNQTAQEALPDLGHLAVDQRIGSVEGLRQTVVAWLEDFKKNGGKDKFLFTQGNNGDGEERIYAVSVDYLFDGRVQCGYQVFLQDDTKNQQYIRLLDRYNSDLQADVAAKTERIVAMHDQLILGMAAMVESRDNSTGGHIRRTSVGVRLLVEAIQEDNGLLLSDEFCQCIIKAAPMHDLGKIAVDDAILRKPGRFTSEEFEKMKAHAAEGARIVHEILSDTDDDEFRRIAENVAHYHHERVDGSGYPQGLKGDEIPLEARIMAIADVYDALVSKRVYKEAFSFEKADAIIMDGMGTQFDARLERYYCMARPHLEEYYALQREKS